VHDDAIIQVRSLSKTFWIPRERRTRLKEHAVQLFRASSYRRLDALTQIDLAVPRGEFLGIIGANGSGKSTLLKIVAGIYRPTRGSVWIGGQVSPFIELGVGFNPELTARENIFLSGTILGLRRRQVAALFDEIVSFAEIEGFTEQKLKNFSSGMLARLGFSISIRPDADILLVDEVLAVGDASFQRKCFDVFRQLKAAGRTILFVSHDLDAIVEFSDRVMVLDRGASRGTFGPTEATAQYRRLAAGALDGPTEAATAPGAGLPRIRSVCMTAHGEATRVVQRGDDVELRLVVDNPERAALNLGVSIIREDGVYCFGTNTFLAGVRPRSDPALDARIAFSRMPLHAGRYTLTVGVFGETTRQVYEMRPAAYEFRVEQRDAFEGLVHLAHEWKVRPALSGSDDEPGPSA